MTDVSGATADPFLEGPERVGEWVYRELRQRILMGQLLPGSRLSVPAIAREFGVSRSPVRDAVLHLVREGLGEETFNRGAVVRQLTPSYLVSLYDAREALEGMTARLAAERFDPALRRRMLGLLREHRRVVEAADFSRHIDVDAAFHREIRAAAASPVLSRMLEEIQGQVMVAMRSTSASGGMAQAVQDHQAIFEALAAGDSDASEVAARRHIARLRDVLRGHV